MRIVSKVSEMLAIQKDLVRPLGLVPTMGALHRGHESLVNQSLKDNNSTVVSIFVNPSQFNAAADLEKYPKPLSELLNTTHTHIISMTMIFLIVGCIFFFNSIITGLYKTIIIIEPFISIIITFGGIWLIRYFNPIFSYLVILSGILMYLSFFIMVVTIFYELIIKEK